MRTFLAGPDRYQRNITESALAATIPAVLVSPTGERELGIAITVEDRPRLVIRTADAIRIAHAIADIAADQKGQS